jgi:uracil-DNA glycosylase family 4
VAPRLSALQSLYGEIHRCEICIGAAGCRLTHDPERVRRKVVAGSLDADVFLVGQSLAGRTQRLSGLPYCLPDGRLSSAGKRLNTFLATFGYSIDPRSELKYCYSSDVIQHYPGRSHTGGDHIPTWQERENCSAWLHQELLIVRPRVLILAGGVAAREVLERYGVDPLARRHIRWGNHEACRIEDCLASAFPVPHFAYRFQVDAVEMVYRVTAARIRAILEHPDRRKR